MGAAVWNYIYKHICKFVMLNIYKRRSTYLIVVSHNPSLHLATIFFINFIQLFFYFM